MAITKQLRDEADRAIEGIQKYYDGPDALDNVEEREHRIDRIEAALDGCNGYTDQEKIQKTAVGVFKLTCATEYIGLKLDHLSGRFARVEGKLDALLMERGKPGSRKPAAPQTRDDGTLKLKILSLVDRHFIAVSVLFIILLSLAFVSGHPDWFTQRLGK